MAENPAAALGRLQFGKPAFSSADAQLVSELIRRFRDGEHPTEWEIGDALNEFGPLAVHALMVRLTREAHPRNPGGDRYTEDRLIDIAGIAAKFHDPEMRCGKPISFSHYEELWRKKVKINLCGLCLDLAARNGRDHKGMRAIIEDVRAHASVTPDGWTRVDALPRWGFEGGSVRDNEDAQLTIG